MPKKKKQAKAKAAKLPKVIAGVKIGRELRGAVEPVLRFASHPMVSETLAAALLAGADTLAAKKGGGAAKAKAKAKDGDPIGLMVAVAAGEIASRIVAAYQAPAKERRAADADRRASTDRRAKSAKSPAGKERRASAADRRTTKDRRG